MGRKKSHRPHEEPQRKKVAHVEISVDSCAELGGQVYGVISALQSLYETCGLRDLTYVDTLQGFREKSDGTNPQTLFALGSPHSRYGRHLEASKGWHRIAETAECRAFSSRLAADILPKLAEPVLAVVAAYSKVLKGSALHHMEEEIRSGERANIPEESVVLNIESTHRANKSHSRMYFSDPAVEQALEDTIGTWRHMVASDPLLGQAHKKNGTKGRAIELIRAVHEFNAIGMALLYHKNPALAAQAGEVPFFLRSSGTVPPLSELREKAVQFADVDFRKIPDFWALPEIQQAARYTEIWPWARKKQLNEHSRDMLKSAHKDCADRAAISYFFNDVCARPDPAETLYLLVTHDGPLIADFVKYITGYEEQQGKKQPHGSKKQKWLREVAQEEYAERGLPYTEKESQARCSVLTGREFVTFVEHEMARVQKKIPPSTELKEALKWLNDEVESLKLFIRRDVEAHGIINKNGTYAERIRRIEKARPENGR